MFYIMLKSKIHNATVTQKRLDYEGSITIDKALLREANIYPGEQVQVLNLNTGMRIETYVIEGKENSGIICLNGPAARIAEVGDTVLILSYVIVDKKEIKKIKPKIIRVDRNNKILKN
jgi:aspartate 1-decarboxylase